MRLLSLVVLHAIFCSTLSAQTSVKSVEKPPLSISDLGKWPSVENPKISNDGRYAIYTYKQANNNSVVIKATEGSWEKWIPGASTYQAVITENSQFVLVKAKDSLLLIRPSKNQTETIADVQSYRTPEEGTGEWLAYQLNGAERSLVVRNLMTGKESRHASVSEYLFSKEGNVLLLKKELAKDLCSIELLYPSMGKSTTIWQGTKAGNFCIDNAGEKLAFIGEDRQEKSLNTLWYYRKGMDSAVVLADKRSDGIDTALFIRNDQVRFNKDGSKVFFYLESAPLPKPKPGYVSVDVWHWQDAKLQSQQLFEVRKPIKFLSVVNLMQSSTSTNVLPNLIQLEKKESDEVIVQVEKMKADYILLQNRIGDADEYFWNPASFLSVYLVNTNDGSRKLLKDSIKFWTGFYSISPGEKFVINYDIQKKTYYSLEIATGNTRDITKGLPIAVEENFDPESSYQPYGLASWIKDDNGIIIMDHYDLWQIDPVAQKKPLCLTNKYGRNNGIIFRLIDDEIIDDRLSSNSTNVLLTSYNVANKNNGIYAIATGKESVPKQLWSRGEILYLNSVQVKADQIQPKKVKTSNVYLLSKQNPQAPPNYFITRDFKVFNQLTKVQSPKESYIWLTTELIEWTALDGTNLQGVLYKPTNFDSAKKYPIIFYYYENMSQNLNAYIPPTLSSGALNIPYFVSNGYLVFTPDIKFEFGKTGESVVNSVLSAAMQFASKSWVDSTKMGLQGFSFGCYETYYLITHSTTFAAAIAADGPSDLVSFYGSACRHGYAIKWHEKGQGRLGLSFFDNQDIYVKNSPIFSIDKISTPILSMHNRNDYYGLYQQGIEFFTAMRRLKKPAWMLQYDTGNHGVDFNVDRIDFTTRMKQFFDHYLKGAPAPVWMTRGIPAKMKGIENGLDLDKTGR